MFLAIPALFNNMTVIGAIVAAAIVIGVCFVLYFVISAPEHPE